MRKRTFLLGAAVTATLMVGQDTGAQVPLSNRCFTPQFWCYIPQVGPVGTQCYCLTPGGPVYGYLR